MTSLEAEVCRINHKPVTYGMVSPIKYYVKRIWLQADGRWWATIYQCDDNPVNCCPALFGIDLNLLYSGDVPG